MVTVPLGLPALPPRPSTPPWRTAWDTALYGPDGFYRRHAPADHFRTSVHGSDATARALLRLVERHGLDSVVDVGAGRGELLLALHRLAPRLRLLGVEVADRPHELPAAVGWTVTLPAVLDGLVVAHEWLDNVPCHVVEVDPDGVPRLLHVDPATGSEQRGLAVGDPGVPASLGAWLAAWWPLEGAPPGTRAEVGTTRDRAWADVVARLRQGVALAVDYGHTRRDRPPFGSLRSYRGGRRVDVVPDGSRDVTADVAVDAVAAAVGGTVLRQHDALVALGAQAARPPLRLARSDPQGYAAALAGATAAADLMDPQGLGAFSWVVSGVGVAVSFGPASPASREPGLGS